MASGLFFGNTSESLGSHCNFASSLLPSCIGWRWSMRRINYSQNDDDNGLLAPWDSMRAPLHPYTYNTCMHAQKGRRDRGKAKSIRSFHRSRLPSHYPVWSVRRRTTMTAAAAAAAPVRPSPPSKQRSRGPSTRPRKAEKGRGRNGSSPLWRPHVSTHSRKGGGRVTHLLNDVFAKSRRGDEIEQCRARFRTHTPSHVQFVRHGGLPLVLRRKRDDGHFAAEAYRYTGERTNDHS